MPAIRFIKISILNDPFGSSVYHDIANRRYSNNIYVYIVSASALTHTNTHTHTPHSRGRICCDLINLPKGKYDKYCKNDISFRTVTPYRFHRVLEMILNRFCRKIKWIV